ncbi:MAG: peroxidase, partial [Planctomycetaceae bacterium]|nr:peroxidase [Planctomycetaceae bacterium]
MTPRNLIKLRAHRRLHKLAGAFQIETCEQRMLLSGVQGFVGYASIDGSGNNVNNTDWGSSGEQLLRLTSVEYGDGISSLAGDLRASAREVSNAVASQSELTSNDRYLTDYIWIWGQFIDHDIDLTDGNTNGETANIQVPTGDPYFDPFGTGTQEIGLTRSDYDDTTGTDASNPRQQINSITAFLDGSVVYGSDDVRAAELRTFSGGKLKTSAGDLLPFNEAGLPNAGGTSSALFLAGDVRANENIALSSMQTLWVREHNQQAERIARDNPLLSDEEIYQEARAIVRAELQAITYNEFLPALLGNGAIDAYSGYDSTVNPGIANVFSTAAYRLGHSLLSPTLQRLNADGTTAAEGNIELRNAFFNPSELAATGIDSLLQGGAAQLAQELDNQIVDDVRNFLFGPPGSGGFDLASLNIQRGRDHGLADYNQTRVDYGLAPVTSFEEISSNPDVVAALQSVYSSVDEIDVWVGMLAEDHVVGSSVGELMRTVLVDQFTRMRDGDRYW